MPKVGKVTANFTEHTEVFELWYDQNKKFYVKGLPQNFLQVMYDSFQPFGFATESELKTTLFHKVNEYKELIKKERKVILYKLAASTHLRMNKVGDGSYSGIKAGVSERITGCNYGVEDCEFGITYMIAKEVNDGKPHYFELKDNGNYGYEMRDVKGYSILDWTESREVFFKSIYDNMQNLILNISKFFSDNDEDVIKRIDTGGANLKLIGNE